ncbi:hypothetical protein ACIBFB_11740 [Nocardiopsis sp. NPDC050513]|uniref:hypothetical protein n=1 Tax=Nocardiopsis sp. NPDC050513 TaxID=3364338 RepID=UPI0037B36C11
MLTLRNRGPSGESTARPGHPVARPHTDLHLPEHLDTEVPELSTAVRLTLDAPLRLTAAVWGVAGLGGGLVNPILATVLFGRLPEPAAHAPEPP